MHERNANCAMLNDKTHKMTLFSENFPDFSACFWTEKSQLSTQCVLHTKHADTLEHAPVHRKSFSLFACDQIFLTPSTVNIRCNIVRKMTRNDQKNLSFFDIFVFFIYLLRFSFRLYVLSLVLFQSFNQALEDYSKPVRTYKMD